MARCTLSVLTEVPGATPAERFEVTRRAFYAGLLLSLVALTIFVDIGGDWSNAGWDHLERAVAAPLQALRSPLLDHGVAGLSALGSFYALLGVVVLAISWPRLKLSSRDQGVLVLLSIGQGILNAFLKNWFGRPRPGLEYLPLVNEPYPSFPSGHSMGSFCVYGFLAYLLVRHWPDRAFLIVGLTALLVVAIGLSRIYLAVHYPGDVLGGFLAAWPCLFLAILVHSGLNRSD